MEACDPPHMFSREVSGLFHTAASEDQSIFTTIWRRVTVYIIIYHDLLVMAPPQIMAEI